MERATTAAAAAKSPEAGADLSDKASLHATLQALCLPADTPKLLGILESALESRSEEEVIRLIVERDPAGCAQGVRAGATMLQWAVRHCCAPAVKVLLDAGADAVATTDERPETPLWLAVGAGPAQMPFGASTRRTGGEAGARSVGSELVQPKAREARQEILKALLLRGVDPNMANSEGDTALHVMLRRLHPDQHLVAVLLNHGADAFQKNKAEVSPLIEACCNVSAVGALEAMLQGLGGSSQLQEHAPAMLLAAARKMNSAAIVHLFGVDGLLDEMSEEAMVECLVAAAVQPTNMALMVLIDNGMDPTLCHPREQAHILHTACRANRAQCVQSLLEAGVSPAGSAELGISPALFCLSRQGTTPCERDNVARVLLAAGVDVREPDPSSGLEVLAACAAVPEVERNVTWLEPVVAAGASGSGLLACGFQWPFRSAARSVLESLDSKSTALTADVVGTWPAVFAEETLSHQGLMVLARVMCLFDSTAHEIACRMGVLQTRQTGFRGGTQQWLRGAGPPPTWGATGLSCRDVDASAFLVLCERSGVPPNHWGDDFLLAAVFACVRLLQDSESFPFVASARQALARSKLSPAWRLRKPMLLLRAVGEDLFAAARAGNLALVEKMLASGKLPVETPNSSGQVAVHGAAMSGSISVMQALVQAGAAIDCCDSDGRTCVHLAASHGRLAMLKHLLGLKGSPPVDCVDSKGMTPLMLAVMANKQSCVVWLLGQGDSLAARTKRGECPLSLALRNGSPDLLDLVLNAFESQKDGQRVMPAPTALIRAAQAGNLRVFERLLRLGMIIDVLETTDQQQKLGAALASNLGMLRCALAAGMSAMFLGGRLLHHVLVSGNLEMAHELLSVRGAGAVPSMVLKQTPVNGFGLAARCIVLCHRERAVAHIARRLGLDVPSFDDPAVSPWDCLGDWSSRPNRNAKFANLPALVLLRRLHLEDVHVLLKPTGVEHVPLLKPCLAAVALAIRRLHLDAHPERFQSPKAPFSDANISLVPAGDPAPLQFAAFGAWELRRKAVLLREEQHPHGLEVASSTVALPEWYTASSTKTVELNFKRFSRDEESVWRLERYE